MEAAQAGLYLCPSHQPFLYQLPEQEQQQVPLPWPSVCQKPQVSWAQQQLQWNRHLKVILPQGKQHVQEPASLSSLQPVLHRGPEDRDLVCHKEGC